MASEPLEERRFLSASPAAFTAAQPALTAEAVHHPAAARAPLSVALSAKASAASRIDLSWTSTFKAAARFTVYRKTAGSLKWRPLGTVAANADAYTAAGLSLGKRYFFRLGAGSGKTARYSPAADATTFTTPDPAADPPSNITYSGPIVISHGGIYSGNWQSSDPNVPAVRIRTSQPVVIQNSHIRSRGSCIDAFGYAANLTVRSTSGYGLNPNVRDRLPGRFLDIDGFVNLVAENNYLEGTSGIYLYNYLGNHTAGQTVKVLRNVARDIDGRYSDGHGGFLTGANDNYYVQFFQINGIQGLANAEVAWNQIINDPGKSRVEENINIFASGGTPASPFSIHDNYILGAYPANYVTDGTYTGGGIMLSDVGSAWTHAYNNQIINTGSEGITISSGHDNVYYNNRILSTGLLPDGRTMPYSNVGATIWNYNHEKTFTNNSGYGNLIGWMSNGTRNDTFVPDAVTWAHNTPWPGAITAATEAGEWTLWQQKLAKAGVKIGPE